MAETAPGALPYLRVEAMLAAKLVRLGAARAIYRQSADVALGARDDRCVFFGAAPLSPVDPMRRPPSLDSFTGAVD